jgi:spermidine synthase
VAQPWETLDRVATREGELVLRCRAARDFLISIDGRVLMTSAAHRSEQMLARLACAGLPPHASSRVLIGGLGMAYTLRAALALLPADAQVVVAELEPAVVRWCQGPLAPLSDRALADPRVRVEIASVAVPIERAAAGASERFDAIALDLFEGPRGSRDEVEHPLYGQRALERTRAALSADGVLAIWAEGHAPGFERRLARAGFCAAHRRAGRGGRRHSIYTARLRAPGPA